MTLLTLDPRQDRTPLVRRLPLIGPIARELAEGDNDYPFYLIAAMLSLWGCAVMLWGLPALVLPAVVAAPLVLLTLVLLTQG
ncbi:MAG: hypothetical protein HLUCCA12_04095 [Rhodobacteraceae bacterium HLUCCA12]|nr:MAG: hypothetical protein HLUCCA12_04095 [Rhodobacteraceae bacterium HLUCCA12]